MRGRSFILTCLIFGLGLVRNVNCGNILVWYTEGSHWINLKPVLETLLDRGHNVTALVPSSSLFMDVSEPAPYHYETFEVSLTKSDVRNTMERFFRFWIYEAQHMNFIELSKTFYKTMTDHLEMCVAYCDGLFKSEAVLNRLREGKFDLMFVDPVYPCSELVAEMLDVPIVYTLRFSLAHSMERLCGQIPAPPSYVPGAMSKLTDNMTFSERVFSGRPTSFCEMMGKADIWLIRTYWDFDYPRPFLPNFKFVGGIHCRPAKPLPKDIEEFVESSGDDGVVVFSLGSIMNNMTKERANTIASALGQIPQKVLWRYSGEKPETLAPNTRLYDWIPQNDLLGHPKTKAFITHGGTNGIYEAIYHGVPMVGIPMFADQPDNMVHMKSKGAAVIMDFISMETKDLVDGLKAVINDPSYKENAMRLSRIHHDRPIHPRDEAVFWIEFVMRHKGAKHLRVQAHNLTWYQYHSLDVFAFLLAIIALVLFIFYKILKSCVVRCCFRSRSKSKKE
ncbi:UDP-glucuronosyltransferase 2A2-like isoform X2 [Chanos chanos]|uniref:UDP-glucuronosyltransferase n=1 Tax=Chanos chanos TaxID=29144 RepID=A0A6J2WUC4_CHACN|nr:UDP-glucuronosyltransferase 2A2-like isoform X2 [Chanos chanos]